MSTTATSQSLLAAAARRIERRDAEVLLAACWRVRRAQLIASPEAVVPADVAEAFERLVSLRATGVPTAYLLGTREFWSLELAVGPAVLVPRPETELLVQRTLDVVSSREAHVVDLGTGSGAIAIALALERPGWNVTATDRSAEALTVARANGARLGASRIEWLQGDWYAPVRERRFDALVSNPPYIAGDDPALSADGLRYEPRGALTPEGDGYAALFTLIDAAATHLRPGGWLLLEHGAGQSEPLRARLVARGFTSVTSHRDLAGHERVTEGKLAS